MRALTSRNSYGWHHYFSAYSTGCNETRESHKRGSRRGALSPVMYAFSCVHAQPNKVLYIQNTQPFHGDSDTSRHPTPHRAHKQEVSRESAVVEQHQHQSSRAKLTTTQTLAMPRSASPEETPGRRHLGHACPRLVWGPCVQEKARRTRGLKRCRCTCGCRHRCRCRHRSMHCMSVPRCGSLATVLTTLALPCLTYASIILIITDFISCDETRKSRKRGRCCGGT